MPDPIEPISLQDALALAQAVPDTVIPVGPVTAKRRAEAVEITRRGAGWRISMPRSGKVTLGIQEFTEPGLSPLTYDVASLATATIEMQHPDGRTFRIPAVLAQAILGWLYVHLEDGTIVP